MCSPRCPRAAARAAASDFGRGGGDPALDGSGEHEGRTATRDTQLRGGRIPAGDALGMFYPSTNRDEEVFVEPNRFRIDRSPKRHLTSAIGQHFCLGAGLARMEIRVLLEELLLRVRRIGPGGTPRPIETNFVAAYKALPIALDVGARNHGPLHARAEASA